MSAKKLTRRAMLKLLGSSTLAGLLAACQPQAPAPTAEVKAQPTEAPAAAAEAPAATAVPEPTAVPAPALKGTITIGCTGTVGPTLEEGRSKLAAAYKDHHPDVEIKWVGPPEGGDYAAWLGTMLAAQPLEIDIASFNYVEAFQNFVDLEKYRTVTNPYTNQRFDQDIDFDFFEERAPDGRRKILATRAVHVGWFYNKNLFQQAGVEAPTNWPEFVDAAKKLQGAGITPMSIQYQGGVVDWMSHAFIDQHYRKERYDFGAAQKGDWNYDPTLDGVYKYDGNAPNQNRAYTFNTARWLKNLKAGEVRYSARNFSVIFESWAEAFPELANEDMYVIEDTYVPFLQQKAAMMLSGGWSIPALVRDMAALDDARREALKLSSDVKIEPFEWGQFNHPGMIDGQVEGPIRTSESASGEYIGVVQKDQAQVDLVMDFLMFWLSAPGYQVWLDGLYAKGYNPGGPLQIKGVVDNPEFDKMFKEVKLIGSSSAMPWWYILQVGTYLGSLQQQVTDRLREVFAKKLAAEEFTKWLHEFHVGAEGWPAQLQIFNLTDADVEHPERKPGA